eukprot:3145796-Rhodomonas_salina.2
MAARSDGAASCCLSGTWWSSQVAAGGGCGQGGQRRGERRRAAHVGRGAVQAVVRRLEGLHRACESVEMMGVDGGERCRRSGSNGQTALHQAARQGHGGAVKVLSEAGANKEAKDKVSVDVQLMDGG